MARAYLTIKRLGHRLRDRGELVDSGNPAQYKVQLKTILAETRCHLRTCVLQGKRSSGHQPTKTIMMVGATGVGKSTMIDAMMNYIGGVQYEDDFRLRLVDLMPDEVKRATNQADSLTDWITCYTIPAMDGGTVNFNLNIIDTPGIGDTRGIQQDKKLVENIREFFQRPEDFGVSSLNAVCFVVKASDARLTLSQKYNFNGILSVFGKDMAKHIIILMTHSDGSDPLVLGALQAADITYVGEFEFNNGHLFKTGKTMFQHYWNEADENFIKFMDHIYISDSCSLTMTKEVLQRRNQCEATLRGLEPVVGEFLNQLGEVKRQQAELVENVDAMRKTDEHTVVQTVWKPQMYKINHPFSSANNCLKCNRTCCFPCKSGAISNRICDVIVDKHCTVCPGHCKWDDHTLAKYEIRYDKKETVTKTMATTLEANLRAKGKVDELSTHIAETATKAAALLMLTQELIKQVKMFEERLAEISLKKNPMRMAEHLEMMIETEKAQGADGYQQRIKMLQGMKDEAELIDTLVHSSSESDEDSD